VTSLLVALAASGGCASAGRFVWIDAYERPTGSAETTYQIKAGDVLDVRVFNQEQMSGKARVRSDGKVTLPFLNDVEAAGYAPGVLAQQLQTRLKDFINAPLVTVAVEEAKPAPISILGQVARPGQYALEAPLGVLQALALAGGTGEFARRDGVYVLRARPDQEAPLRIRFHTRALLRGEGPAASFRLQGGDVIVVE
jgi:polysaccharide export outer membrane protein